MNLFSRFVSVAHDEGLGAALSRTGSFLSSLPRRARARHLRYRHGETAVRAFDGFEMHLAVRADGAAGRLLFERELDPPVTRTLRSLLGDLRQRHDSVVTFELGAHHGYYTMVAASITDGPVVAVEPAPDNAARVRANVAHNGFEHVEVLEAAVGSERTTREFAILDKSYRNRFPEHSEKVPDSTVTVDVYPLDDILDRQEIEPSTPLVVRLDAEYHENAVVEGMTETLASDRPVYLLMEIHSSDAYSGHTALERLREHGFDLDLLGSEDPPTDPDELVADVRGRDSNVEVLVRSSNAGVDVPLE